jgi:hypothetical protein
MTCGWVEKNLTLSFFVLSCRLAPQVLEFEENTQSGKNPTDRKTLSWWARQDLNLGPTDYESAALTAELRAPDKQ